MIMSHDNTILATVILVTKEVMLLIRLFHDMHINHLPIITLDAYVAIQS